MSSEVVLYDVPGPKAKRRALIGTVVVLALVVVALVLVARRLADAGQFDGDLWAPVFNPGTDEFSLVWGLLGQGLVSTLTAAGVAIVLSLVVGTALGSARMLAGTAGTAGRAAKMPIVVVIELFRGLPVVITIFLSFYFFRAVGFRLDFLPGEELMWYLIVGLTLYNSVIIAEILRAGVSALPQGQAEAGRAVGMSESLVMRVVLLPQAFRVMLPALISQIVVILKDTSLGYFIGYLELLNRSLRISQNLDNPIQMLLTVAVIFIVLNSLLSWLATWVERRLSRAGKSSDGAGAAAAPAGVGVA